METFRKCERTISKWIPKSLDVTHKYAKDIFCKQILVEILPCSKERQETSSV